MNPTPIFENAVDSLTQGIASYLIRDESDTAIKHSILAVYHSIELFLKEAIARVHPVLIYRNLDKRITDDSLTVGLEEAIARLDNLGRGLSTAECLGGSLPKAQQRLVEAWAEIHRSELQQDWDLLQSGQPPVKIEPLR